VRPARLVAVLVYRDRAEEVPSSVPLERVRAASARARRSLAQDDLLELLVECGELESAVADRLAPAVDDLGAERSFRDLTLAAARALVRSWWGDTRAGAGLDEIECQVARASAEALPTTVPLATSEGYAWYGLHPEAYIEAAKRFARAHEPARVLCVGIRSIGASLSAVVGTTLEQLGWTVRSCTVRPRGHPFDRRLAVTQRLSDFLATQWEHALVIDEGPGLSGSSFVAVADALTRRGWSEQRIAFFPSWETDGANLRSPRARQRWTRHPHWTVPFEEIWSPSGPIPTGANARDLSAGSWRALLYPDAPSWPAVQPQHERRKLLRANGDGGWLLYKFAGLGRYGRAALHRGQVLADAGFAPPTRGLTRGYSLTQFIEGHPLRAVDGRDPATLESLARYLVQVRRSFATGRVADFVALAEMARANTREILGGHWADRLGVLESLASASGPGEAVALDARMLPHEWVRTSGHTLKTDATDHHDDHFYPGPHDIAWDLAGACVEFSLDAAGRAFLLDRYAAAAKDQGAVARLPAYEVAYAAFRLGYAVLARQSLAGSREATRWARAERRYRMALVKAISGLS
jgi:hypothetical protein